MLTPGVCAAGLPGSAGWVRVAVEVTGPTRRRLPVAAGQAMPAWAEGLPEQSYPFRCGMAEELRLFQHFSLHGNDIFYSLIGV